MLILTYSEWCGVTPDGRSALEKKGIDPFPSKITQIGMATRLPLGAAIRAVAAYDQRQKDEGAVYVSEHSLLSVSVVDDLSDDEIRMANMLFVERLGL